MSNVDLAVRFFVQIAVILLVCRVVGVATRRLGQPQVVAEMIAGVLLGPSFFGLFWPEWQSALFPWDRTQQTRDTQSYLFPAAQLGLAAYMFVVGMEFRVDIVRRHLRSSVIVSAAGMIVPFVLGAGLACVFNRWTLLFSDKTTLSEAILFLGASMCITAFPMLARIIHFKRLAGTTMGTVAIGAGAIDDATAWCLLAVVLGSIDGDLRQALVNVGGGLAFVAVALGIVRPLLARLPSRLWVDTASGAVPEGALGEGAGPVPPPEEGAAQRPALTESGLTAGLACMALGAWVTDAIGLHAVFGAFVMGASIPRGVVSRGLIARIQPLAVGLLLPLFFTYSGLNTRIGLLDSWFLWGMCALVLAAAVLGKGVACWLAALWTGLPNREALGIGTLMNARGLMELIIINVGLQRGVISEGLFAILVIMAVVTTLMASPLFDRLAGSPAPRVPDTTP